MQWLIRFLIGGSAVMEARSMIFGSIAFCLYANACSWILMRYRPSALTAAVLLLPVWFAASFGLMILCSRAGG
jgi:hypothetical protein